MLCFPLGHASTPPPLAEPVLGRCHPPWLSRRGGAPLPSPNPAGCTPPCTWAAQRGPGARRQLLSLPGSRTGPGSAGNPCRAPRGAWASEAVGAERCAPRPCLGSRLGTGAPWSSSCQCFIFVSPSRSGWWLTAQDSGGHVEVTVSLRTQRAQRSLAQVDIAGWQRGLGAGDGSGRLGMASGPAAPAGFLGGRWGHGLRRGSTVHTPIQGHPEDSERRWFLHPCVPGAIGGQYFTNTLLVSSDFPTWECCWKDGFVLTVFKWQRLELSTFPERSLEEQVFILQQWLSSLSCY